MTACTVSGRFNRSRTSGHDHLGVPDREPFLLEQRLRDLLEKERVATGAVVDQVDQPGREGGDSQNGPQHRARRTGVQRIERQGGMLALVRPRAGRARPARHHHQQGEAAHQLGDLLEHAMRGVVGPMPVLQQQRRRLPSGDEGDEGRERLLHREAVVFPVQVARDRIFPALDREELEQERDELLELATQLPQAIGHLGGFEGDRLPAIRSEPVAEYLDEGQIGRAALGGLAAALEQDGTRALERESQLEEHPALPHPGLAQHRDEPPLSRDRRLESALEHGQLALPAGELGEADSLRRLESGSRLRRLEHPEGDIAYPRLRRGKRRHFLGIEEAGHGTPAVQTHPDLARRGAGG